MRAVMVGLLLVGGCVVGGLAVDEFELAFYWAPVHYQDVDRTGALTGDHSLGGRSDYITAIDFDGDWNTRNNWENADDYPLLAFVYYSVVETVDHWYVVYAFYHPRDWDDYATEEHENDLEGFLAIVRKDGTRYGHLDGIVTVYHRDFYSYTPEDSQLRSGRESVDGTLAIQLSHRPVTTQQPKGHGLKAWPYVSMGGEDYIIYYPSRSIAEEPSSPYDHFVEYRLVDIFEPGGLWDRRCLDETFADWGTFAGDTAGNCGSGETWCASDSANAPWRWNDHDDDLVAGVITHMPAALTANYFSWTGVASGRYLSNPYTGECHGLWVFSSNDTSGGFEPGRHSTFGGQSWGYPGVNTPVAGDFNGDSFCDVGVKWTSSENNGLWVISLNDGRGNFLPGSPVLFGGGERAYVGDNIPIVGDFNGDGYDDIGVKWLRMSVVGCD